MVICRKNSTILYYVEFFLHNQELAATNMENLMKKIWVYDPHSGGVKIPKTVQQRIVTRILDHAKKNYAGNYNSIDIRFRGQFCYIDAYTEPYVTNDFNEELYRETREQHIERLRNIPTHLCRLRYFGDENSWSMAFYTYSHERYEPSLFNNGTFHGTPEEAFDTSSVYLMDRLGCMDFTLLL